MRPVRNMAILKPNLNMALVLLNNDIGKPTSAHETNIYDAQADLVIPEGWLLYEKQVRKIILSIAVPPVTNTPMLRGKWGKYSDIATAYEKLILYAPQHISDAVRIMMRDAEKEFVTEYKNQLAKESK